MRNKLIVKIFTVVYILTLLSTSMIVYADSEVKNTDKAGILKELGLFLGTDKGYELERKPTRAESAVMLVRVLGKESEARQKNYSTAFTDVPGWAGPYIGYLFNNKLTYGTSSTEFGSKDAITANQYLALILRALGYSESVGDFNTDNVFDKAKELGLLSTEDAAGFKTASNFTRDDVVGISYNALETRLKNSNKTLIEKLIYDEKVISEEVADKNALNNNRYSASGVIVNTSTNSSVSEVTINMGGTENTYAFQGSLPDNVNKGIFIDFDVNGNKISKFNIIGNYYYNLGVNGDNSCYIFKVTGIDTINKTLKVQKLESQVYFGYGDELSFKFDQDINVYDARDKNAVSGGDAISYISKDDYVWVDKSSASIGAVIKNIVRINKNSLITPKIVYLETKGVVLDVGIDANGPTAKINIIGFVKTFNLSGSAVSGGVPISDIKKGNYIEFRSNSSDMITSVESTKTSTFASSSVNIFRIANIDTGSKLIKCYRIRTDGTNIEDTTTSYYFKYDPSDLAVYDVTDKDAIRGGLSISDVSQYDYVWLNQPAGNNVTTVTKIIKINDQVESP